MIAALWSKACGYLIAAGAGIAFLVAVYAKGKADAVAAQKAEHYETVKQAREIEHEVQNLDGDDVDRRLSQWMRDK